MKTLQLACPYAYYTNGMKILCSHESSRGMTYCGHQYYRRCKGWWALNEAAARCKLRQHPADNGGKNNE